MTKFRKIKEGTRLLLVARYPNERMRISTSKGGGWIDVMRSFLKVNPSNNIMKNYVMTHEEFMRYLEFLELETLLDPGRTLREDW